MQPVKIPFLHAQQRQFVDKDYLNMIKNRFSPSFQVQSMTTLIIIVNIAVFIVMHILYSPSKYDSFMQWPIEMDKWLLDIQLIKSSRKYIYQILTSMFVHSSYLHLIGNIIFALFTMYELERCWKPSILWGLLGGVAAQCLAIITLEGRFLGFSGVLCAYFGMFLGTVFSHRAYLQERYRQQFWMILIMVVFMAFILVGFGTSALVHLFGFTFGVLLGISVYPKMPQSQLSSPIDKLFKVITFGITGLVVILAIII